MAAVLAPRMLKAIGAALRRTGFAFAAAGWNAITLVLRMEFCRWKFRQDIAQQMTERLAR